MSKLLEQFQAAKSTQFKQDRFNKDISTYSERYFQIQVTGGTYFETANPNAISRSTQTKFVPITRQSIVAGAITTKLVVRSGYGFVLYGIDNYGQ
jgi:hypothetical protein